MSLLNALVNQHQINGLNLGLQKVKREMVGVYKALSFAAYEEKTICSLTGKGCIDTIWLGQALNNTFLKNALLKVYVDGEASPSIQFDLGALGYQLATGYTNGWSANTWSQANTSYPSEMACLKFPIPYSTSILIKLQSAVVQDIDNNHVRVQREKC